jgi:hypothetical protein
MKKLLKYLLPVILVVSFWSSADESATTLPEKVDAGMTVSDAAYKAEISAAESEFCLPRQVSFANSQRVQSSPRRTGGAQRSNLEFTKSGKVFNVGIRYFVQKRSIIAHSALMEPSHRLLYLGKLII